MVEPHAIRQLKRSYGGIILALLSLALLAISCDTKKDSGSSSAGGAQQTSASIPSGEPIDETVSEPTTISWWHFWTDPTAKPVIEEMVRKFESENPNIKVNLTGLTWANGHEKIVIAMAAGRGPDLLELGSDWIPEFVDADQLADLTVNLYEDKDDFRGWEPATRNGRVYAQPWILGTRVMFYNTDLLKRAGFDEGFIPITFAQFLDAAKRIDSLGREIHGWGSNAAEKHRLYKKFLPFFWSHLGSIYSENNAYCVISSMEGGRALKYYKELNDSAGVVVTQRLLEDAFLDGKIGIVFSGDWLLKRIRSEKPDFPFTTGLMPGQNFNGISFLGGEYLAVNNNSEHKGAALKLLRFIRRPENQILFCKANRIPTPASVDATKDEFFTSDPHMQTFIKQLNYAKAPPFEPTWVYIEEQIEDAVARTLFEDVPPFVSLYEARNNIQEISRSDN